MLADTPAINTNLPTPISTFIGRERALGEIARLLTRERLVTLTGPGGTGKTRLALRVAASELAAFPDGVWLVELAPIATPELVAETIAKVAHVTGDGAAPLLEALAHGLAKMRLLLVLDNCEHLLGECARIVAYLLARCPALAVIATSREPLAIGGERVVRVPPLELPASSEPLDEERLLTFDSIRLFLERAQAAEPSFRFSSVTAPAVVEICRRLDGIPLALELAAMRVRGMGVAYLGARLDDRFRLLTAGAHATEPRQQTLNAAVAWSYDLLSERERVVMRRLGVFAGDFSPEAAEAVCISAGEDTSDATGSVFDILTRLVDKSLVQFDQSTGLYRQLETIRLYCQHQLDAAGEQNHLRRQHFAYYLNLAEDGAALLGGPGQLGWFARLEQEHDNYRAALSWAIAEEHAEDAARLALSLWQFWHARTYQREGMRWLEQALALEPRHPLPPAMRARLLNALGSLANVARRLDRSKAYHEEALRLWTAAGDQAGMAQALCDLGWVFFEEVNIEEAMRYADEGLPLAEVSGDKRLLAHALLLKGLLETQHDFTGSADPAQMRRAAATLERSLAIWRELGDQSSEAATQATLAANYAGLGDDERAKPLLLASARWYVQSGDSGNINGTLVILMNLAGKWAADPQMARDSARIHGAMLSLLGAVTEEPSPWETSEPALAMERRLTKTLGTEGYAQALAEGRHMTRNEVFAVAERITRPANQTIAPATRPTPMVPPTPHASLTRRELDVLRLVSQGMTNAQVGRELVITPRTVNAHLTSIYGKLGVVSRSGAIRYAVDHALG
ncbi:MAG TPA: LuxR C-terminal-related transcriptional regulator [Ktedonobacterales bacterium]